MQRSLAEPQFFKPEGPNADNLKIVLKLPGNHVVGGIVKSALLPPEEL